MIIMSIDEEKEIVKERKIVRLNPKRISIGSNRQIIEQIQFFYHYRTIHDFIIEEVSYKVLDTRKISIPGMLNEPIGALYKNSISEKTLNLIKEKKPSAILYVYTGYEPVISYKEYNPTGLVELIFERYLLLKE